PSYVCYQERGHLIALDARTGREIWCRSELPVGTFAVGDDDHIVLLRDDASTAEVLRSSDGVTIAHWNWTDAVGQDDASPQLFSHLVAVQGTLGLWHSAPPQQMGDNLWLREDGRRAAETTATVLDLSTGRPLWSKTVSADSWIVSIDESLLGNLSPEGKLTLWDWQTGEVVTEHVVQLPSKITGVFVETDAARA